MAYDIGTARGVIEMEYNGRGVTQAQQDVAGLEKATDKSGLSMKKTARGAGIAGLAIAAGLGLGVTAAVNFEQRMSAIEAVSGATGSELKQLSDKALQLGKDTAFSASEAATAMEELVKAGLSVDDVLNGAADATVALAAAGEIALPEAATIASNAMNQFGLAAADLPRVADLIAGAANASAIDVSDLGQSMQQAGAVANLVGLSFEDTATAIAIMGNAGIKGSDAGTSLKSMLSRLQPTTKKAREEMEALGLITADGSNQFYDAEGNLKSMSEVTGVLSNSLKGMSKQQKQAALQVLFGSDAIRAAAILSNEGAKGFDKMNEAMNKTTAAEVAATRMDNVKGRIEELKGSVETLGIVLGGALIPFVDKLVVALTDAVNWFLNLSDGQQKMIVMSLAAASALLLIVAGVLKLIIFFGKVSQALAVLKVALAGTWVAALGPILLVIAAIALIIGIIVLLWNKSETFKAAVLAVWAAIQAAAQAVASWFMSTFVPALQAVWAAILSAVQIVWNIIMTVIRTAITIIKTIVMTGLNALKAVWMAVWNTFGPLIKAVFNLIVAIIRLAWAIIRAVVITGINVVKSVVSAGFNAVKSVTSAVWNAIKAVISAVWGVIGGYIKTGIALAKSVITTGWTVIKTATKTMWDSLKGIIDAAIAAFMVPINAIKDKVLAALNFVGDMYNAGKALIQGLIDGIAAMIGKVTGAINSITQKIKDAVPGSPVKSGPLRVLNRGRAGKEIVKMVIDGIESMSRPMEAAVATALPTIEPTRGWASPADTSGRVRRRTQGGGPRSSTVSGSLSLVNGRAYISGIAEDVFDDFSSDNDRRG